MSRVGTFGHVSSLVELVKEAGTPSVSIRANAAHPPGDVRREVDHGRRRRRGAAGATCRAARCAGAAASGNVGRGRITTGPVPRESGRVVLLDEGLESGEDFQDCLDPFCVGLVPFRRKKKRDRGRTPNVNTSLCHERRKIFFKSKKSKGIQKN